MFSSLSGRASNEHNFTRHIWDRRDKHGTEPRENTERVGPPFSAVGRDFSKCEKIWKGIFKLR